MAAFVPFPERETTMLNRTLFCALLLACAGSAHALTIDELIAKNVEARGGLDKLKAIESIKSTGKLAFTGDFAVELDSVAIASRKGKVRQEASLQGLTSVQAYDGKEGWQIQPFGGRKDPEKLSADDVKGLADDADIDGPLVDYKAKGSTVEYLGTEDVDGTDAHKIKVSEKDGDVKYIYLDPDYFLEIRVTTQRKIRGTDVEFEADLGNYEKVADVYFPFSVEAGGKGGPKNQKVTIEKIEVNVPIEDAMFAFPAAPATAK